MTSKLRWSPSALAISVISGDRLPASFRTGTMMETAGGAALASVSFMICPIWPRRSRSPPSDGASFLWGHKLPGNPFNPCERRPGQRSNRAIRAEHEGEPARREPVAHQQHADDPDDGADHHVARKMRREYDTAEGDDDGIGPHERPGPRPQGTDSRCRRECVDRMARREAGVFDAPAQRPVAEGARAALHQRARTPNQALR